MKQNRSLSKAVFNFASPDLIIFAVNNHISSSKHNCLFVFLESLFMVLIPVSNLQVWVMEFFCTFILEA